MESQKSVYIKLPNKEDNNVIESVKKNLDDSNVLSRTLHSQLSALRSNSKLQPLLKGKEPEDNINKRHKNYIQVWAECQRQINNILEEESRDVLEQIAVSVAKDTTVDTLLQVKIPTTFLLTGLDVDTHNKLMNDLQVKLQNQTTKVIILESRVRSVTSIIKTIAFNILNIGSDQLKNLSLDTIAKCCDEQGLTLVILVKNTVTFNQAVLAKFLKMIIYRRKISVKLILNFASFSAEYVESSLNVSLRRLVGGSTVRVLSDKPELADQIFRQVFLKPHRFLLTGLMAQELVKEFIKANRSINAFVESIHYILMTLFFTQPFLSLDFGDLEKPSDIFETKSVLENISTSDELILSNYFRRLPSVQAFIDILESKVDKKSYETVLLCLFSGKCWSYIQQKLLPFAHNSFANQAQRLCEYIDVLMAVQEAIGNNNRFLLDNNIVSSNTTRHSLNYKKLLALELYSFLMNNDQIKLVEFAKGLCSAISTLVPHFFCELISQLSSMNLSSGFTEFRECLTKASDELKPFMPKGNYYVDISDGKSGDGLKSVHVKGKILYETVVDDFVESLNIKILQPVSGVVQKSGDHSTPMKIIGNVVDCGFEFHELQHSLANEMFVFNQISPSTVLSPPYRTVLENGLLQSSSYLGTQCSPLIISMYKLYREAPLNVNLYDYYDSFKSMLQIEDFTDKMGNMASIYKVDKDNRHKDDEHNRRHQAFTFEPERGNTKTNNQNNYAESELFSSIRTYHEIIEDPKKINENWDKISFAMFVRHLEDLRHLGLFKTNPKTSESIEKSIWKTPNHA